MCKPVVLDIQIAHSGPCGFEAKQHSDACAAFTLGRTWRERVANVFRRWADRVERRQTYTVTVRAPRFLSRDDVRMSLLAGLSAGSAELNTRYFDRLEAQADAPIPARPFSQVGPYKEERAEARAPAPVSNLAAVD